MDPRSFFFIDKHLPSSPRDIITGWEELPERAKKREKTRNIVMF
jgi:hypothetical protein